ncbi:rapid alkalinization factor [Impatiens glandulifera]|uniref:rapid alkalinization factor n=1 Tax=Impatiens glandulifera TaxID=253017 RepID=UPI001FB0C0E8|nr:rapid alkalinization factor [Impatiens glandulifera]
MAAVFSGYSKVIILLATCFMAVLFISSNGASASMDAADQLLGWIPTKSGCRGSIGECLGDEEELDLDSEINRRILATTNYISYGALQRNSVPCSRRGASYYNCRSGAQANPYTRGCSAITRCRS